MPPRSALLIIAGIVLLAIGAEGLLTLMDAMIKALSRYPTFEIAFMRFAFGMVDAVAYALWMRPGWPTRDATQRPAQSLPAPKSSEWCTTTDTQNPNSYVTINDPIDRFPLGPGPP